MRNLSIALVIALFARVSPARATEAVTTLCNVRIRSPDKISLSGTEKKWLCGDPSSEAWKEIPVNQKESWLRGFLQSRGYLSPVFTHEAGELVVETREQSQVKTFTVEGAPVEWDWSKRRRPTGSVLDPSRLDEDEKWAVRSLQARGYPCPEAHARAFLDDGGLLLEVDPGPKQRFGPVQSQGATDLDAKILERFNAFFADDFFDVRLLELTSDRVLREDLYLSTFYDVICGKDRIAHVRRRYVPAAPRLLTVGIGFDTENGPLVKGHWKVSRLTPKADSVETTLYLSFRDVEAQVLYRNHFPHDLSSRFELDPKAQVERRNEDQFQSIEYLAESPVATAWELRGSNLSLSAGPQISRTRTLFSLLPVPSSVDALRFVARAAWLSHYFEYYTNYASEPREGYNVSVEAWTEEGRWLSDKTIHKLRVQQEALWNLGNFDPPWLVLGWRGFAGTYFYNPHDTLVNEIPPSERFFLGGDDDIRGFGRQKLRGQGIGYLTAIYQGLELRLLGWLPFKLQPFLFLDAARTGLATETIDSPLYWAPGFGMRWSSPVGTLRATLARGFATDRLAGDPVPDLQFFVSFGKEF